MLNVFKVLFSSFAFDSISGIREYKKEKEGGDTKNNKIDLINLVK